VSQVYDKGYSEKKTACLELKLSMSVYKLQSSVLQKIAVGSRSTATTIIGITCQTYIDYTIIVSVFARRRWTADDFNIQRCDFRFGGNVQFRH